jgi:hypothetical protein
MEHWRRIRPYTEWFEFYGEEEFVGYEQFKQHLEVHYVPKVFIKHRVNITARKSHKDYLQRARRSIRSDWYSWLLFIPQKICAALLAILHLQKNNKQSAKTASQYPSSTSYCYC